MDKTKPNINQLHDIHNVKNGHRTHPSTSGSIVTSTGQTKKLTQSESASLFALVEKGNFQGEIDVEIEFLTEKEGLKMAKKFSRLAENPAVKLNVTFKKIENEKVKN